MKIIAFKFNRVHLGETNLDDTLNFFDSTRLFSALYNEAITLGFKETFDRIKSDSSFRLTDSFPMIDDVLYFPKPIIKKNNDEKQLSRETIKTIKKIGYIAEKNLNDWINGNIEEEQFKKFKQDLKLGEKTVDSKVRIERNREKDPDPIRVGVYSFGDNVKLWVGLKIKEDYLQDFEYILKSLSFSGIGGKRSSGLGGFDYEILDKNDLKLEESPNQENHNYMLMSSAFPKENELTKELLDNSTYLLTKKSGFTYSLEAEEQIRKKDFYMFKSGSVFKTTFEGDIFEVTPENFPHEVFSFGRALFLNIGESNE